jgi:hypothetical protein
MMRKAIIDELGEKPEALPLFRDVLYEKKLQSVSDWTAM